MKNFTGCHWCVYTAHQPAELKQGWFIDAHRQWIQCFFKSSKKIKLLRWICIYSTLKLFKNSPELINIYMLISVIKNIYEWSAPNSVLNHRSRYSEEPIKLTYLSKHGENLGFYPPIFRPRNFDNNVFVLTKVLFLPFSVSIARSSLKYMRYRMK